MILSSLKALPVIGPGLIQARDCYRRATGRARLKHALRQPGASKRIVIGASGLCDPEWIPTDIEYLNLLKPNHWDAFFAPATVDAMLAEHVWEHLTPAQGATAAATCFKYLSPGGYLRVAVPDGLHPDPAYREWVRVGGSGLGADDHKVLYTYKTFAALFERAGFHCDLLEYFDEQGGFHASAWSPQKGRVLRSIRFDERNSNGAPNYTSVILDAIKPRPN